MSSSENWKQIGMNLIDEVCNYVDLRILPWTDKGGNGTTLDVPKFVRIFKKASINEEIARKVYDKLTHMKKYKDANTYAMSEPMRDYVVEMLEDIVKDKRLG